MHNGAVVQERDILQVLAVCMKNVQFFLNL